MLFRFSLLGLALVVCSCSADDSTPAAAARGEVVSERTGHTESLVALGPAFLNDRVGTGDGPTGRTDRWSVDFEDGELPSTEQPGPNGSFAQQSPDTALSVVSGGPPGSTKCLRIEQQRGGYPVNGRSGFASLTWMLPDGTNVDRRANALSVKVGADAEAAPEVMQMGARVYLGGDRDAERAVRTVFESPLDLEAGRWRETVARINPSAVDAGTRPGGYDVLLDRAELLPHADAVYWQFLCDERPVGPGSVYLDELEWYYRNPFIASFPHVSVRWARPGQTVVHPTIIWNTHRSRARNLQIRGRGWRVSLGATWKGAETKIVDEGDREVTETGTLDPGRGVVVLLEFTVPATGLDGSPLADGDESVFHIDVYEDPTLSADADDARRVSVAFKTVVTLDAETPPAITPPAVADLTVSTRGDSWADLAWTCPVDRTTTLAYAIRYSHEPIADEASWERAVPVESVPAVAGQSATQLFTLRGLSSETEYFAAIRSVNSEGEGSELASVQFTTTAEDGPPPVDDEPPADQHPAQFAACEPLAPPSGGTISVTPSQARELKAIASNAVSGTTILLADGVYDLSGGDATCRIVFARRGVTLRSATGNRDAVVLDGGYGTSEILQIVASDVTIADLTVRRAAHHCVHVVPTGAENIESAKLHNLILVDAGRQAVKVNASTADGYADFGQVTCCRIALTDAGRARVSDCFTGGLDVHSADGWLVANNTVEGFWCETGLAGHGLHFWRGCRDTIVENNTVVDCARAIGFGMESSSGGARAFAVADGPCAGNDGIQHLGGVIRNNAVVVRDARLLDSAAGFDVGISLELACDATVAHNTVVSTRSPFSSIEFRFEGTRARIVNNLVSHNIRRRNGASGTVEGNVTNATLTTFVDIAASDVHLRSTATSALTRGVAIEAGLADRDMDGAPRDLTAPDVGADEFTAENR